MTLMAQVSTDLSRVLHRLVVREHFINIAKNGRDPFLHPEPGVEKWIHVISIPVLSILLVNLNFDNICRRERSL